MDKLFVSMLSVFSDVVRGSFLASLKIKEAPENNYLYICSHFVNCSYNLVYRKPMPA